MVFDCLSIQQTRCDNEIDDKSHKKVVKSVCYDYEEVSAAENENVDKLIDSAFGEQYKLIYKVNWQYLFEPF